MKTNDIPLYPGGGLRGFGPLGLLGQGAEESVSVFNQVISTTVGVMTVVAFIWFIIQFIVGVIGIITSGGDKQKFADARNKIQYALIGVVIVVAAIFLIELVGSIIGIEGILKGPALLPQLNE